MVVRELLNFPSTMEFCMKTPLDKMLLCSVYSNECSGNKVNIL